MIKTGINIGSFTCMIPSSEDCCWINIDILNLRAWAAQNKYNFLQQDVTQGLPFLNESVDYIVASHFIEHLKFPEECMSFLRESYRVLKNGGKIRLCYPDNHKIIEAYLAEDMQRFDKIQDDYYRSLPKDAIKFWQILTSGHSCGHDLESIMYCLAQGGFREIIKTDFDSSYDVFPEVSYSVTAKKPEVSGEEDVVKMVDEASKMANYKLYLEGKIPEGKEEFRE